MVNFYRWFIAERFSNLNCKALKELESVGSGLVIEAEGDEVWIGRSRQYAVLNKGGVVHCAGHGTPLQKKKSAEIIKRYLMAREDLRLKVEKKSLLSFKKALKEGKQMGSEEILERKLKFDWDGKRELRNSRINPFQEWTTSKPLLTVDHAKHKDESKDTAKEGQGGC